MHIKQSCKSTLVNLNILLLTSHYSCCKITCGPKRVETKTQLSPKSVFFDYIFWYHINHYWKCLFLTPRVQPNWQSGQKNTSLLQNLLRVPLLKLTNSIHSFGMWRMWIFLTVLSSFFHSFLLYTFSCHSSPPIILPSSLTSSCHLFLVLPLNLVSRFIHNNLLGILFSSILCTCPKQHNLCNLIVSVMVGF
jgi:hypothetical protein